MGNSDKYKLSNPLIGIRYGFEPINGEQRRMIKDCLTDKRAPLLDDRELAFIENIEGKNILSEKQRGWLISLWERVTEDG